MDDPQLSSEKQSECAEKSSRQPAYTPQDEIITYPEGGIAAWTVALGSWSSMMGGLGMINSVGVLEAYVSTTLLTDTSKNSTGWIFGIYVFVSYFCGIQVGPIFDARGPRELIMIGSVFLLVGTFTLGLCTGC
jgi:MFS family permease